MRGTPWSTAWITGRTLFGGNWFPLSLTGKQFSRNLFVHSSYFRIIQCGNSQIRARPRLTGKMFLKNSSQRSSIMCKWTRPFWRTDCQRWPKSLSSAQVASLCSASIERAQECLQGWYFVRCCHSTHSLLFRVLPGSPEGSAAVCDPNPPRPFARSRDKQIHSVIIFGIIEREI